MGRRSSARQPEGMSPSTPSTQERAGRPASDYRRPRVAHERRARAHTPPERAAARALDRVLELLERRWLSASDLRIMLAVKDGDAAISDLAKSLGWRSDEVRRGAARLYGHGLLRWAHNAGREEAIVGSTRSGLATLQPLLTAVG
jgi:hypothetical protein